MSKIKIRFWDVEKSGNWKSESPFALEKAILRCSYGKFPLFQ
jgi:hypothetical protein